MKKTIRYTFIIITLISIFFSCNPDDTNDNPQPTEDPRDKFVGNWTCSETSSQNGQINPFYVTITLDPSNSSQILLANFYQIGTSQKVYGVVASSNATVPNQTVSGLSIRGSGNIANNNTKINWNYIVDPGGDPDTCTAVFSK